MHTNGNRWDIHAGLIPAIKHFTQAPLSGYHCVIESPGSVHARLHMTLLWLELGWLKDHLLRCRVYRQRRGLAWYEVS